MANILYTIANANNNIHIYIYTNIYIYIFTPPPLPNPMPRPVGGGAYTATYSAQLARDSKVHSSCQHYVHVVFTRLQVTHKYVCFVVNIMPT